MAQRAAKKKTAKKATGAAKRGRGRPEYVPTEKDRRWVKAAMCWGIRKEAIAETLGCAYNTFTKHFEAEIEHGAEQTVAAYAGTMHRAATPNLRKEVKPVHVTAARFMLQARGGTRFKVNVEDDPDATPIEIDTSSLSTEEKRVLAALLKKTEREE